VETDLQWFLNCPVTVEVFAPLKLVCTGVGQTGVKPDVLLVVGEAPVGDA